MNEDKVYNIIGKERYPYVYILIKENYIYIGETQRFPAIRLSEHISIDGTFLSKLQKIDEEIFKKNCDYRYYTIPCEVIYQNCSDTEMKKVTQYLEHILHTQFIINSNELDIEYEIISDTSKTTPNNMYRYSWVKDYASELFNMFCKKINQKKEAELL